jgi:hypothetical protein
MSSPYRAALLTIFADGRIPSLRVGDSTEQTVEDFRAAVIEADAIMAPGKLGLAFDHAGNEIRYIMARVVNGLNAGFVARRPSGTTSVFLFADPTSAHEFAAGFADCEIAVVIQAHSSAALSATESRSDFAAPGRQVRPDFASASGTSWLTGPSSPMPVPDLAPLIAPEGFCPRCIIRPLPSDPQEAASGVCCLACRRLAALIRERRAL